MVLNGPNHCYRLSRPAQNVFCEKGRSGLAIRAGHARELQLRRRLTIEVRTDAGQSLTTVRHVSKRDLRRSGELRVIRYQCHGASAKGSIDEAIAIAALPSHSDKQTSGTNLARIIGDTPNVGITDNRDRLNVSHDLAEPH